MRSNRVTANKTMRNVNKASAVSRSQKTVGWGGAEGLEIGRFRLTATHRKRPTAFSALNYNSFQAHAICAIPELTSRAQQDGLLRKAILNLDCQWQPLLGPSPSLARTSLGSSLNSSRQTLEPPDPCLALNSKPRLFPNFSEHYRLHPLRRAVPRLLGLMTAVRDHNGDCTKGQGPFLGFSSFGTSCHSETPRLVDQGAKITITRDPGSISTPGVNVQSYVKCRLAPCREEDQKTKEDPQPKHLLGLQNRKLAEHKVVANVGHQRHACGHRRPWLSQRHLL